MLGMALFLAQLYLIKEILNILAVLRKLFKIPIELKELTTIL